MAFKNESGPSERTRLTRAEHIHTCVKENIAQLDHPRKSCTGGSL